MKTNNEGNHVMPTHLEDDELVAYLDGERDAEMQQATRAHLESCWYCRGRISSVERSIENFLKLRHEELLPPEMPPAGPAVDLFRARLAAHRELAPSHSFIKQYAPDFGPLLSRISKSLSFSNYSLRTQVIATRALAAIVMVSTVVGFVLMSGRFNTVSAAELLRQSIEAQSQILGKTDQPVTHQLIQIKANGTSGNMPVSWEIWNDTVNARVRTTSKSATDSDVIEELRSILRSNRMNEHRPLSAISFKSWSDSLASKSEEVEEGTQTDGNEILTIRTVNKDHANPGTITSASYSVRERDYHPISLSLSARTTEGDRLFEIVEQDFKVVSLRNLDPSVFADPAKIEIASTVGASPLPGPSIEQSEVERSASIADSGPVTTALPTATTADEVEVLDLLNRVGADVTEQLSVTRAADGRLLIEGLVESDRRKSEILTALSPVKANRAVRIRIQTIEEATLALQRQKAQGTPSSVDRVEVEKKELPADADLRRYFANRGGDVDSEISRFASRVVRRSQSAAFQASALNRMVNRFSRNQLREMDPAARAKFIRILNGYAAVVKSETASLRNDLQPIFGGFDGGSGESVGSDTELIASARRLYEAASANDRAIRSAFMLSSGSGTDSAIRSEQFRRSVALAESLAAAIEKAK